MLRVLDAATLNQPAERIGAAAMSQGEWKKRDFEPFDESGDMNLIAFTCGSFYSPYNHNANGLGQEEATNNIVLAVSRRGLQTNKED